MIEIVVGVLIFAGIVTVVLLRKNKFGGLKLDASKDGVKVEVEAAKPEDAPVVQSESVTTQNIYHGLDEAGIKKLFEEQERNLKIQIEEHTLKLINSGAADDQEEINILQKELTGVQAKLADTKKALADRNTVLAETEKALENEKLKNAISEGQLADAKLKLVKGDSSQAETLFARVLQDAKTYAKEGAEAAFRLGKLAEDRIDYQIAQNYYSQAVNLTLIMSFI